MLFAAAIGDNNTLAFCNKKWKKFKLPSMCEAAVKSHVNDPKYVKNDEPIKFCTTRMLIEG